MTLDEAKKVAAICSEADGGCDHCVFVLWEMLIESFPEFKWSKENYGSITVETPNNS